MSREFRTLIEGIESALGPQLEDFLTEEELAEIRRTRDWGRADVSMDGVDEKGWEAGLRARIDELDKTIAELESKDVDALANEIVTEYLDGGDSPGELSMDRIDNKQMQVLLARAEDMVRDKRGAFAWASMKAWFSMRFAKHATGAAVMVGAGLMSMWAGLQPEAMAANEDGAAYAIIFGYFLSAIGMFNVFDGRSQAKKKAMDKAYDAVDIRKYRDDLVSFFTSEFDALLRHLRSTRDSMAEALETPDIGYEDDWNPYRRDRDDWA